MNCWFKLWRSHIIACSSLSYLSASWETLPVRLPDCQPSIGRQFSIIIHAWIHGRISYVGLEILSASLWLEFKGKRSRPKRARLFKQVAFLCSKFLSIRVDFVDGSHWSCGCVSKAQMPKMPWKWLIWVLVGCRKQEPIPIYLYLVSFQSTQFPCRLNHLKLFKLQATGINAPANPRWIRKAAAHKE